MKIRVLGSSGSELPDHNLPAFLIDDSLLMDAGTIGLSLSNAQQWRIRNILITHAHLDHIKGIPFLLDNIILTNKRHTVTLLSGRAVLDDLKRNVLNDRIWPDFSRIPDKKNPVLKFNALTPGRTIGVDGYRILCEKVTHSVPAFGFIVTGKNGKAIAYTGDTGPTEQFWKRISAMDLCCLITEVSFPNVMSDLAVRSGHLTAGLLKREIEKMGRIPRKIFITHAKPQYMRAIRKEIGGLKMNNISILKDNQIIPV